MSDNKKYYYLKLKDNFFDSDEIIILESMPDGHLYSNILLKLYLRSLKNNGRLMFNERIPFNSTMLSQVTRHSVGNVEKAVKIFQELGLIDVMDNGAIYMLDIQNFIGESSTEADRKRMYRAKIEAEKSGIKLIGQKSDKCPDKNPPELELELELELDKEIYKLKRKKATPSKKKFGCLDNVLLTQDEHVKLSERFPDDLDDRIERLSLYVESTGKKYKSHYATIIMWAKKDEPKQATNRLSEIEETQRRLKEVYGDDGN